VVIIAGANKIALATNAASKEIRRPPNIFAIVAGLLVYNVHALQALAIFDIQLLILYAILLKWLLEFYNLAFLSP
jgi:hypothetical protein